MAVLYVTEYNALQLQQGNGMPVAAAPAIASQTIVIGGGSLASSAFNANTNFIRVHTDAICSFDIGATPTASTSLARMAANQTEYFGVQPAHKIAVISNT